MLIKEIMTFFLVLSKRRLDNFGSSQIMESIAERQSILTKDSKPASLSSFLSLFPFLC